MENVSNNELKSQNSEKLEIFGHLLTLPKDALGEIFQYLDFEQLKEMIKYFKALEHSAPEFLMDALFSNTLWIKQLSIHFPNDYDIAKYEISAGKEVDAFQVFKNAFLRDYRTINPATEEYTRLNQRQIQLRSLIKRNDLAGIKLMKPTFIELNKVKDACGMTVLDYVAKLQRTDIAEYIYSEIVFPTLEKSKAQDSWLFWAALLGLDKSKMQTLLQANADSLKFPTDYIDLSINNDLLIHRAIKTNNALLLNDILTHNLVWHFSTQFANTAASNSSLKALDYLLSAYRSKVNQSIYDTILKDILFTHIDYKYFSATHSSIINILIINGITIDCKNENGETALMLAAKNNNLALFKLLIEHKANVKETNNQGESVFVYATQANATRILKFINEQEAVKRYGQGEMQPVTIWAANQAQIDNGEHQVNIDPPQN